MNPVNYCTFLGDVFKPLSLPFLCNLIGSRWDYRIALPKPFGKTLSMRRFVFEVGC